MKNYTMEDVPNILNSISWQLKRIADSLENTTEQELGDTQPLVQETPNSGSLRIRELLKNLNDD